MRGQWTSIVGLAFPLMLFSMFALATGDITPPAWNNTQNNTPATFDAAGLLTFITSWTDSSLLDRILFEVNRSGTHTNHTASIFIGNDSFRINTSSDFLEHDEQLNDVGTTVLTYLDLEALSAGSINNSRGLFLSPQQLTVATNTKVAYTIDPDDATNTPAWYLKFNTGSTAYHYKMTFTPSLEANIDNSTDPSPITGLDNATLFILGKNYSIVNANYTNHTVIIILRDERTNDTIRLADTNITSKELGGQPVVVNNNTITDVVALIDAYPYPSFVDFNFFTLNWTADEDIYVPVNSSLSDKDDDNQIFFDFDIWFVGARESESENIWISSVGDDEYVLNFTNKAGNQLNVPLIDEDAGPLRHGNENFDLIIMEGNVTTWADAGVIDRNDYFVISDSSAKNTYFLRYRTLDSVENEIEIQEVWSGDEIIIPFNFTNNQTAVANFTLGDKDYDVYIFGDLNNADIIVDLNGNGTMEAGEIPYWYTKYGAYILVNSVPGNGIKFFSEGGNDTVGATGPTDAITVTFANTTANLVDLSSISGNVTLQTIGDTNDSEDYSIWGTRVSRTSREGPDLLNLTYPDNQTEMLVYYTTGNIPDAYFVTLSGFPAGTHTWRSIANDTSGNVNSTPWYPFNISRATSTLNLTLNGTAGNVTISLNSSIWLNGSVVTGDSGATVSLFLDGASKGSGTSVANLTTFTDARVYTVRLNYTPTQNYTTVQTSYFVTVGGDSCGTLNASKTLWSNITTTGTCFTINASNIVLDGAGYHIICSDTDCDYAIYNDGFDNITIRNFGGTSGNFSIILRAIAMSGSTITNNTMSIPHPTGGGGGGGGDPFSIMHLGMWFSNSTGDSISLNTITEGYQDGYGIRIDSSSGFTINSNVITTTDMDSYGIILIRNTTASTITSNTITTFDYRSVGILLWNTSGITIQSNTINTTERYAHGINISTCSNCILGSNVIFTNGSSASAINLYSSNDTAFSGDIVDARNGPEFLSEGNSNDNRITGILLLGSINFTSHSISNVSIDVNTTAKPADPSGKHNLSDYLTIANTSSAGAFIDFNLSYAPSELSRVNKDSVLLYCYNSSAGNWTVVNGSSMDPGNNTLRSGNITSFPADCSLFASFGDKAPVVLSHTPTGTMTNSTVTLTATTDENATCRYSTTANTAYASMTSAMTGNATTHTATLTGLTTAIHYYYVRCNNSLGVVSTYDYDASFTVLVDTGTPPPGGGGGGGGAPTTDTTSTFTKVITSVSKATGVEMTISKETIPVNLIRVAVTDSATNVEISVSAMDEKPETVATAPTSSGGAERVVYKYLDISQTNLAGKIQSATIDFKVSKAWLDNNSADKTQIVLQRHTGSTWEELPTEVTTETAANVYYSATTTGFSVFAIAVKEEEQPAEPPVETPVEPPVEPPVELPEEQPIEPPIGPPSKSHFQSTLFTIAVATILGTTGIGYIYRNRLTIGAKIDDLLESLRRKREGRLKTK